MVDNVFAVDADVKVGADGATVALAWLDLALAVVARGHKGRLLRVVQVVDHHHAAVLGAPQTVKLIVVALAERQEGLRGDRQHILQPLTTSNTTTIKR